MVQFLVGQKNGLQLFFYVSQEGEQIRLQAAFYMIADECRDAYRDPFVLEQHRTRIGWIVGRNWYIWVS